MHYIVFFNSSTQALADGYVLESAAVVVRSKEQLIQELAKRMPPEPFDVIFEGTGEFRQIMEELTQDTIWPRNQAEKQQKKGSPF